MQIILKPLTLVFLAAVIGVWFAFGQDIVIAFAVGFTTMVANVWLTRKTVRQFTSGARTTLVGLYLFKMVILFGLLFVFLRYLSLNVIGLVGGLGLPMAVMIFTGNRWMEAEDDASEDDPDVQVQTGV